MRLKPGEKLHRWVDRGTDATAYCQDCRQPTNAGRHIERAGHHLYVCPHCAGVRIAAEPLRLTAAAGLHSEE